MLTFSDNLNTANLTDLSNMFCGSNMLKTINFGPNFNTSNVKNMSDMFSSCRMLESLDLSTFDTSQVEDMSSMFLNSTKLKKIMVTKNRWVTTQADIRNMFERCGVSEVTYV